MIMRYKDKDKNVADVYMIGPGSGVNLGNRKCVVAVHAHGVWFTPAQARRFAKAIIREADKVTKHRGY
jgi:hypothetical protein